MKLSAQSHQLIEEAIKQALLKFAPGQEQTTVTDIYLMAKPDSGELAILDDENKVLYRTFIEEWNDNNSEDFNNTVTRILRAEINKIKDAGGLEQLTILKPYSFVLVDEDKETLCELVLVDDDTYLLNEELLKGLDDELNEFLKDLLEN